LHRDPRNRQAGDSFASFLLLCCDRDGSLPPLEMSPNSSGDLFGSRSRRKEAEIAAVRAYEINEAGVIDRVAVAIRRTGSREIDFIGERDFPNGGILAGQRDQPRME